MKPDTRVLLRALIPLFAATLAVPAAAPAHTGAAFCTSELKQVGATYESTCSLPFQGFPIGIAGLYDSEPNASPRTGTKAAEIHLELLAKLATGAPQPIGVECQETGKGVARCTTEYNPFGSPLTAPEPAPSQIVSILCSGHSHASFSRLAAPAGRFACWSTDEGRGSLAEQGWFTANGVADPSGTPAERVAATGITQRTTKTSRHRRVASARQAQGLLRRLAGPNGRRLRAMLRGLGRTQATTGRRGSVHTGAAFCTSELKQVGATYESTCSLPFQGFPIGIAGLYDSEPNASPRTGTKAAEIHLELLAKLATGAPQPIGVECQETGKGVARCTTEYNPFGSPLTAPEPAPSQIVSILCSGHSHASFSRLAAPAGRFACWSTDEGRGSLAEQGWFTDNGFQGAASDAADDPAPSPLGGASGLGISSQITTVPFNTYAPSTILVSRSLGLTYTNLDTANHDVVAGDARRADGSAPWCETFEDPEDPGAQGCPLFWSELIPGNGTQTPVRGLKDTTVGESYSFYCSIHPYMTGTIQVVE